MADLAVKRVAIGHESVYVLFIDRTEGVEDLYAPFPQWDIPLGLWQQFRAAQVRLETAKTAILALTEGVPPVWGGSQDDDKWVDDDEYAQLEDSTYDGGF